MLKIVHKIKVCPNFEDKSKTRTPNLILTNKKGHMSVFILLREEVVARINKNDYRANIACACSVLKSVYNHKAVNYIIS